MKQNKKEENKSCNICFADCCILCELICCDSRKLHNEDKVVPDYKVEELNKAFEAEILIK
jgi:hypothetical protein